MSQSTHYNDVIMSTIASQITSLTIVYSTVYSGADQRKHQSSASLAFVRGIHRGPVNSLHKGPVTPKMFPFDDVIMCSPHLEVNIKPKNYVMYQEIYNCICQNTKKWRNTIHHVTPTAQLLFKSRFPKGGPTCRKQVFNPRHQTPQGQSVAKPETELLDENKGH